VSGICKLKPIKKPLKTCFLALLPVRSHSAMELPTVGLGHKLNKLKGKCKVAILYSSVGGVFISLSQAVEPV